MAQICEITKKRIPHSSNLTEGQTAETLRRKKYEIKEIKSSVRLRISQQGLEKIKEAGGLPKFIGQQDPKNLSPKLKKVFDQLPDSFKPKQSEENKSADSEAKA